MPTNIVLDDDLVAEAMKATGAKTKREIVDPALRELMHKANQRRILDLVGEPLLDPDHDVVEVRRGMAREFD